MCSECVRADVGTDMATGKNADTGTSERASNKVGKSHVSASREVQQPTVCNIVCIFVSYIVSNIASNLVRSKELCACSSTHAGKAGHCAEKKAVLTPTSDFSR